jgi:hypothetical protein
MADEYHECGQTISINLTLTFLPYLSARDEPFLKR